MKYTIVIPAYNAVKCIGEMLESLCHQTQGDYEVVVVNDGSTDNLRSVIAEWKDTFATAGHLLHLIDKDANAGLAKARNSGLKWTIENSDSDYILFLDADDSVEPDMLEHLNHVCDGKTDFVIFGYTEDYYDGEKLSYRVMKSQEARAFAEPSEEMYLSVLALEEQTMFGYAWNKAYRVAFLQEQGLRFETVTHIEDILFNIAVVRHVRSMAVVDALLYHYANRGQVRLTGKYLPEYFVLQKRRVTEFISLMEEKLTREENLNQAYEAMAAVYFRSFFSAITRDINQGIAKADTIAWMQEEMQAELYENMVKYVPTEGKAARMLYQPLARIQLKKAYRHARFVAFVQKHFSGLFNRLKQNR